MARLAVAVLALVLVASCAGTVAAPIAPPDGDGDGLVDSADRCSPDPEDTDHHEDDDGCPDLDDDLDGLRDVEDLCPWDPEDRDAYQDADGCPDPDNDSDRILDPADRCPCVPEVFNGYEDEDGCPDRGYVLLEERRILILEKIYFARGSAVIGDASVRVLDAIAATLNAHETIRVVEVSGHASRGEPNAAALSLARAVAVREALLALGVAPTRLTLGSHGAELPAAPGRTRRALETNRRVEFNVVESDESFDAEQPLPGPVPNCPEVAAQATR